MESASESIHYDMEKVQLLLAQLDETASGEITREMFDDVKDDMEHCEQLCHKLEKASSYLRSINDEIVAFDSEVAARIADSVHR